MIENILNADKYSKLKYVSELKEELVNSIKEANSLPKPVKFIKPHFNIIKEKFDNLGIDVQGELGSLMSFCSISVSNDKNDSVKFFFKSNKKDLFLYSDDYLNCLAGELSDEIQNSKDSNYIKLCYDTAFRICEYFFNNHLEINGTDLLLEIDKISDIINYLSDKNAKKVLDYLLEISKLSSDSEEYTRILESTYNVSLKFGFIFTALSVAMKLNDTNKIAELFELNKDSEVTMKQLAFYLSRNRVFMLQENEKIFEIIGNTHLSEYYKDFLLKLDCEKPKKPEEVYKTSIDNPNGKIDSALLNMADVFVNSFLNVGLTKDTMTSNNNFIGNLKEVGQFCASASIGLINMWDFSSCSNTISEFLDLKDGFTKAGALLGLGISNCGVWNENDETLALVSESLESDDPNTVIGALLALGFAYAGSNREDLYELIHPVLVNSDKSISVSTFAALALGLVFIGEAHEETVSSILSIFMTIDDAVLNNSVCRFLGVGLALLFLGNLDRADAVLETLDSIDKPLCRYTKIIVEVAAFAGTGNVLKIQKILRFITEEAEKDDIVLQVAAMIGISFIAMGEKTGVEMCLRMVHHIMQYASKELKRGVPILLSFLSISNPQIIVCDLLLKLAYDDDEETSKRALLGFGIVGFGTNNSRIAGFLRNFALYYEKDLEHLYCIRISQGFLHAGKGTIGIDPYFCNKFLYSKVSMAGLFIFANSMLDTKNILIDKFNYLVYSLVLSVYPKFLYLMNEKMMPLDILVRVGNAVDTVTQVGDKRQITGFQTHSSPVIIGLNEKSELVDDEYLLLNDCSLEGVVILKRNPNFVKEDIKKKTSYNAY